MIEDLHETIKKIKQSLRLSMNGIVSAHQRKSGLDYKINFGVEIPRIKSIAAEYKPCKELSEALWQENIRESKLLAIFLLPKKDYSAVAEKWIAETTFTEIADHLSRTILCKIPTAKSSALRWMNEKRGLYRYCGYLTFTHITRQGVELNNEEENRFFTLLTTLFEEEENNILCRSAFTSLCNYINDSNEKATRFFSFTGEENKLSKLLKEFLYN